MGGEPISIIQTVMGAAGMFKNQTASSSGSDAADKLEAQRAAEAEQERQEEAAERKRERDKVLEARSADRAAKAKTAESTLSSGGAGLLDGAAVSTSNLKQKLGE